MDQTGAGRTWQQLNYSWEAQVAQRADGVKCTQHLRARWVLFLYGRYFYLGHLPSTGPSVLRMLGLHLAYTQGLHNLMNLNGKAGSQCGSVGCGVHQPLPKALQELRAAADAGPGCQKGELSTRGFPLFQGNAEKQGRK